MSPVPGYRITQLGTAFDVGAGNQIQVLTLPSPRPPPPGSFSSFQERANKLDRVRGAGGAGQRKAAAEVSVWSASFSWWQFSHSQPRRSVSRAGWSSMPERDLAVREAEVGRVGVGVGSWFRNFISAARSLRGAT